MNSTFRFLLYFHISCNNIVILFHIRNIGKYFNKCIILLYKFFGQSNTIPFWQYGNTYQVLGNKIPEG